ncbi:hypothetical protein [Evansella cellulosilytica]|uniref:Uncharacterized protein n=1 Tax=Evansella cellulosilytica (strain ATCC 21833 / DSM 2522 / FERM P-1141 / JCM 9156 / N-4) TaxID=649639 RepID=E6TX47_EVAC2|nr:hypothetical protein [Evansella cellulosilytica]ADU31136.1 hypothetical protein Bcell_2885 [Evansella cellulosilytica DSM 2522]
MAKEKLTPVQVKQKVIYLQSELQKYRNKVKDYEENYHYKLLEELKVENDMLKKENRKLEDKMEQLTNEKKGLLLEKEQLEANIQIMTREKEKMISEKKEKELEKSNNINEAPFVNPQEPSNIVNEQNNTTSDYEWFKNNVKQSSNITKSDHSK